MFGPAGTLYVYRSYGIHWCANVVCGDEGFGEAVLLRALEPTQGLEEMRRRRGFDDVQLLCSGPGRLTQALAITDAHDGVPLDRPPFQVIAANGSAEVVVSSRVGISRASHLPWRYSLRESLFVSRPRPRAES